MSLPSSISPTRTTGSVGLNSLEDLPLNTIPALPLSPTDRIMKRTFDVLFALFALFVKYYWTEDGGES